MVQVNGNCILNLEGSYSGTFDCGCYNDLIITIFENQGLVGLYEGSGVFSTQLEKTGEDTYYFFFMKDCEWNGVKTEFVQFEMEVVEEGELWVTAKWTKHLGFEVVYECSGLFVD